MTLFDTFDSSQSAVAVPPQEKGATVTPPDGRARNTDPETSQAAAESILPVLGDQCLRVLRAVVTLESRTDRKRKGVTAYEALKLLTFDSDNWQQSVIARRLTDLREKGCVRDSGETRVGGSGRLLIAWTATEDGRTVAVDW